MACRFKNNSEFYEAAKDISQLKNSVEPLTEEQQNVLDIYESSLKNKKYKLGDIRADELTEFVPFHIGPTIENESLPLGMYVVSRVDNPGVFRANGDVVRYKDDQGNTQYAHPKLVVQRGTNEESAFSEKRRQHGELQYQIEKAEAAQETPSVAPVAVPTEVQETIDKHTNRLEALESEISEARKAIEEIENQDKDLIEFDPVVLAEAQQDLNQALAAQKNSIYLTKNADAQMMYDILQNEYKTLLNNKKKTQAEKVRFEKVKGLIGKVNPLLLERDKLDAIDSLSKTNTGDKVKENRQKRAEIIKALNEHKFDGKLAENVRKEAQSFLELYEDNDIAKYLAQTAQKPAKKLSKKELADLKAQFESLSKELAELRNQAVSSYRQKEVNEDNNQESVEELDTSREEEQSEKDELTQTRDNVGAAILQQIDELRDLELKQSKRKTKKRAESIQELKKALFQRMEQYLSLDAQIQGKKFEVSQESLDAQTQIENLQQQNLDLETALQELNKEKKRLSGREEEDGQALKDLNENRKKKHTKASLEKIYKELERTLERTFPTFKEKVQSSEIFKQVYEQKKQQALALSAGKVNKAKAEVEKLSKQKGVSRARKAQANNELKKAQEAYDKLKDRWDNFFAGEKNPRQMGTVGRAAQLEGGKYARAIRSFSNPETTAEIEKDIEDNTNQQSKNNEDIQKLTEKLGDIKNREITPEEITNLEGTIKNNTEEVEAEEAAVEAEGEGLSPFAVFGLTENDTIEDLNSKFTKLVSDSTTLENQEGYLTSIAQQYNSAVDLLISAGKAQESDKLKITDILAPQEENQSKMDAFEEITDPAKKLEFIIKNGAKGDVFTLPDGTTIEVLKVDEEKIELQRGAGPALAYDLETGELTLTDEQRMEQTREEVQNNPPSDVEISNILDKKEKGSTLSFREQLILDMFPQRVMAISTVRAAIGSMPIVQLSMQDYMLGETSSFLASYFGIDLESDLLEMSLKYMEILSQQGKTPESIFELMELAGMNEEKISTYQSALSTVSMGRMWAFVTQADILVGSNRSAQLKEIFADYESIVNNDIRRLQSVNFENLQDSEIDFLMQSVKNTVIKFFDDQEILIKNTQTLDFLNKKQMLDILEGIQQFGPVFKSSKNPREVLTNYVEFKNDMEAKGVEITLSTLGKVIPNRSGVSANTILTLNDSADLLLEFDDFRMSDKAKEDIANEKEAIYVKNEKGYSEQVNIEDITPEILRNPEVIKATEKMDEILSTYTPASFVSSQYVAAYFLVNGNTDNMMYRVSQKDKAFIPILDFKRIMKEGTTEVTQDSFNKEEQQQEVENKTCK